MELAIPSYWPFSLSFSLDADVSVPPLLAAVLRSAHQDLGKYSREISFLSTFLPFLIFIGMVRSNSRVKLYEKASSNGAKQYSLDNEVEAHD